MKRIIPLLILTLIIILPIEVKALSVDKNNLTIEKGNSETINLSATLEEEVTEISFTLVYTSNDVKAYYNIADGLTDSTPNSSSHKIVLSEPTSGTLSLGTVKITINDEPTDKTGIVNIYRATDNNDNETQPSEDNKPEEDKKEEPKKEEQKKEETKKNEEDKKQNEEKKEETEKDEDKKETVHLLEKIESNIVKIELKNGIYEYTVRIKEEVEELDLKPIVKDSKYKVEISNQKISELNDNQIIITVKNEEEIQEYKIKVKIMKVDEIEIDNSEFESTYTYKGKWIVLMVILSITLFVGLLLTKKK